MKVLPVVRRSGSAPAFTVKNTPPAAVHRIRSGFRPCGSRRKGPLEAHGKDAFAWRRHSLGSGEPVIKGEPAKNGSGIPHKAAKLRPHRLSCRLRSCCEEFLHVRFLYCRSIAFLLFGYSPVSRLPSEPKPCEMAASDI